MPILLTVASVQRWISLLNDPENQLKVLVTGNKGNVAVFPLTQRGIMLMTPGANPEVEKYEVFATATAANLGTSPMKTFTTASALRRYIGKFCPHYRFAGIVGRVHRQGVQSGSSGRYKDERS